MWLHLDHDGKEEAGAELLHALGRHAAVIAVVGPLLQDTGRHVWQLPVAWKESGRGNAGRVLCACWPWLGNGQHGAPGPGKVAWEVHVEPRPPAAQLQRLGGRRARLGPSSPASAFTEPHGTEAAVRAQAPCCSGCPPLGASTVTAVWALAGGHPLWGWQLPAGTGLHCLPSRAPYPARRPGDGAP